MALPRRVSIRPEKGARLGLWGDVGELPAMLLESVEDPTSERRGLMSDGLGLNIFHIGADVFEYEMPGWNVDLKVDSVPC